MDWIFFEAIIPVREFYDLVLCLTKPDFVYPQRTKAPVFKRPLKVCGILRKRVRPSSKPLQIQVDRPAHSRGSEVAAMAVSPDHVEHDGFDD